MLKELHQKTNYVRKKNNCVKMLHKKSTKASICMNISNDKKSICIILSNINLNPNRNRINAIFTNISILSWRLVYYIITILVFIIYLYNWSMKYVNEAGKSHVSQRHDFFLQMVVSSTPYRELWSKFQTLLVMALIA
jgi:uncharacterized ion transporter superfamily protein YfcC